MKFPQLDTSSQFGHEVWHLLDDEGGSEEPSSRGADGEVRSPVNIMGMPVTEYPGREAAWWEVAGWKVETAQKVDPSALARVEIQSPLNFLTKNCDDHTVECFTR